MTARKASAASPPRTTFKVKDCAMLTIATGKRAYTLKELFDMLTVVRDGSIYYHFWGGMLRPAFTEREFNNDFAAWARNSLSDDELSERLAVIDPTRQSIKDLRQEMLEIIEDRMDEIGERSWMRADSRFEFMLSQIVIFDTHRELTEPRQLATEMPLFTAGSVFYHFIDARRRLDRGCDDFTAWIDAGPEEHSELCDRLCNLDPYFVSLTEIRDELARVFQEYFGT